MESNLAARVAELQSGSGVLVVVPSMTFDSDELAKIVGAGHFEERMLWLLQVLRNPSARVVYVTSEPLSEDLVGYSASLTGRSDARARVTLVTCDDPTPVALTHKVLERADVQGLIRDAVGPSGGVMMCHVATPAEDRLAKALSVDLFACSPELSVLGTKSSSRQAFRDAGVPLPDGAEDLQSREAVVDALIALQVRRPRLRRAVIKLNDSFAGGGNAIVDLPPGDKGDLQTSLLSRLDSASFVAAGETSDRYFDAFGRMGGIVEEMIEGSNKTSPSVQCIINPDGTVRVISTHEQILGGADQQTFFGCRFPALPAYSVEIAESARRVGETLGKRGVTGHISVDFVCRQTDTNWEHFAIEVNLRMGGTTAPISFLESATGDTYNPQTGSFRSGAGQDLFYTSADRIQSDSYRNLDPGAVLHEANRLGLHFNPDRGTGSVFYMLGALPTVGKLGLIAIDETPELADERYDKTISILDQLAARTQIHST